MNCKQQTHNCEEKSEVQNFVAETSFQKNHASRSRNFDFKSQNCDIINKLMNNDSHMS